MKKQIAALTALCCIFVLFVILTLTVDVAPVGPDDSPVGFSTLNMAVFRAVGVNKTWYMLTQAFGLVALATAAAFGLLGLCQLVRRRSLKKVDRGLFVLAGLYLAVAALYTFFELVPINYRPVLMSGSSGPEASFPSSHTLLICTVMASAAHQLGRYVRSRFLRRKLQILCVGILVMTVFGRLFSGVHWFTDILGGILLSGTLLYGYYIAMKWSEGHEA